MLNREIVRGQTTSWVTKFRDKNGGTLDFTGNRYAILRIRQRRATTNTESRDTRQAAEFSWTTQSIGDGEVTFSASETLAVPAGEYLADWWVYDDVAGTKYRFGTAIYTFVDNPVGAP